MVTRNFVPGYLGTITIDSNDLSGGLSATALNRTKADNPKPVFGQQYAEAVGGQISGEITFEGHVNDNDLPLLEASYAKDSLVPFTLDVGDGATIDAGDYAGNAVFRDLEVTGAADGEWDVSGVLRIAGAVTYTAPTP